MDEGRKNKRFAIQMLIELSYNRENYIEASGINLSATGIGCRSTEALSLSSMYLMLKLSVKNEEEIVECDGMVVHSKEADGYYDSGIHFTYFKDDGEEKLKKFLTNFNS